jgi:hypothetical protein
MHRMPGGLDAVSAAHNTDRLYAAAQLSFEAWCRARRIRRSPPSHEAVADYLRDCAETRGASVVPVHLSAIAALYREHGHALDTRHPVIQEVVKVARAAMPPKRRASG